MSTQATHVRELIKETEGRIADIDSEVEDLSNRIAQRKIQRGELLATLEKQRCLIAPIGHLPFEILGMIFLFYLDIHKSAEDHYPKSNPGHYWNREPPLIMTLLRVCRQWKAVAYGTPGAWSQINISFGHPRKITLEKAEPLLQRAGAFPLEFTLDLHPWKRGACAEGMIKLLQMFDQFKPNFRSVSIQGLEAFSEAEDEQWCHVISFVNHLRLRPQSTRTMKSFRFQPYDFPSLSRETGDKFPSKDSQILEDAFATFDALICLKTPVGLFKLSSPLFKRIKTLQVINDSRFFGQQYEDITPVVLACGALETLVIVSNVFQAHHAINGVTLPDLRRLVIKDCPHIDDALARIRFPKLQELIIGQSDNSGIRERTYRLAFRNLIERPTGTPPLEILDIRRCYLPEKTLIWALEHLPTLLDLKIHDNDKIGTTTITALSKSPTSRKGWICPKLSRVEVEKCSKINATALMELIRARSLGSTGTPAQGKRASGWKGKGKEKDLKAAAALELVMLNGTNLVLMPFDGDQNPGIGAPNSRLSEDDLDAQDRTSPV